MFRLGNLSAANEGNARGLAPFSYRTVSRAHDNAVEQRHQRIQLMYDDVVVM